MSAFSRLSLDLQAALRREAPGWRIRVPAGLTNGEAAARNVRIRDTHRAHLEGGMPSRQSIRLLMLEHELSRARVFEILKNSPA